MTRIDPDGPGTYCLELAGDDDAFAAREARVATGGAEPPSSAGVEVTSSAGVEVVAPGLAIATALVPDRVRRLAYTHRASEVVGRTRADVASARETLAAASIDRDRSETVAVRARNVRSSASISTSDAERELGAVLVDRGFTVDLDEPDHELRALFADDVCILGWLVAASVRDFGDRRPTDRPFFQPGAMAPLDARAVANLAGAGPGATLLDPMCGTGGILIEAGLAGADVLGLDAQSKMVQGTRENLQAYVPEQVAGVVRGDATRLPLSDDAIDGVAFDAPYGRQSKIERHGLEDLVGGALGEAHRVAPRAVVVADRSWAEMAREVGWRVEDVFERRVHRSLVRFVHVLSRS